MKHEPSDLFPEFIRSLPMVDKPVVPLLGWLLQATDAVAMFYELPEGADLAEHVHGAQWGVVLRGSVDFSIGGETRTLGPGDTYSIPAGVPHSAYLHPGTAGIDVFADADRYRARTDT
ncbi:MAG: cupin domain-containing protein [Gaiella sp.]